MENRGAQIDPLDSLQHGRQKLHEFETGRRVRPLPVTRRLHASSSAPSSEVRASGPAVAAASSARRSLIA